MDETNKMPCRKCGQPVSYTQGQETVRCEDCQAINFPSLDGSEDSPCVVIRAPQGRVVRL
jgi:LSD1 subclass zinc finger protein